MKSHAGLIIAAAAGVLGLPAQQVLTGAPVADNWEWLENKDLPVSWPGIDLDLNERRLVQLENSQEPIWMTELEKIQAMASGIKFFDITEHPVTIIEPVQVLNTKPFPPPNASEAVFEVINLLSTEGPQRNLATFTSFRTRHYRSDTGRQSQKWLLGRLYDTTKHGSSSRDDIDISEFHHSWGQHSVIAKIPGSDSCGTIIISAHQDSTNMWPFLPAPGADDDGSGSMTILEAYRALLESGFQPKNDVEFHWYSAEEGGLLGSQAVAAEYKKNNANILAQIQFDMTAFVKKGTREEVGVITDFVDSKVVDFVKKLIDAYLDIPWVETKCGYACSDHASWTKNGYPSSFAIESSFENSNHDIHSTNDRMDLEEFSFDHMLEFSKLAAAFAVELADYKP